MSQFVMYRFDCDRCGFGSGWYPLHELREDGWRTRYNIRGIIGCLREDLCPRCAKEEEALC